MASAQIQLHGHGYTCLQYGDSSWHHLSQHGMSLLHHEHPILYRLLMCLVCICHTAVKLLQDRDHTRPNTDTHSHSHVNEVCYPPPEPSMVRDLPAEVFVNPSFCLKL